MSYFDEILNAPSRKGKDTKPLWKLKITDEEYKTLKSKLCDRLTTRDPSSCNLFVLLERECALFVAEYWKREYSGGAHSVREVYEALSGANYDEHKAKSLIESAKRGAQALHLQIFEQDNRHQYVDSLLYQGGLPLRLVCSVDQSGVWYNFTKKLVRGHINLDDPELGLGVVATNLRGVREFADTLANAVQRQAPRLMPFDCRDRTDTRYRTLYKLRQKAEREARHDNPFAIKWLLKINRAAHKFQPWVQFVGAQKLNDETLKSCDLELSGNLDVETRIGDQKVNLYRYRAGYCREKMERTPCAYCHIGEIAEIASGEKVLASATETFNGPRLYVRARGNVYELADAYSEQEAVVLLPQGWSVDGRHESNSSKFTIAGQEGEGLEFTLIFLTAGQKQELKIINEGSRQEFKIGNNKPLYSTIIDKDCRSWEGDINIYTSLTSDKLYLLSDDNFDDIKLQSTVCDDNGERMLRQLTDTKLEFRSRHGQWGEDVPIGQIKVRRQADEGPQTYVREASIININSPIHASLASVDADQAVIDINWPHGDAVCLEADALKTDRGWRVRRENLARKGEINFELVPSDYPQNRFKIRVKAPFTEMSITDNMAHDFADLRYLALTDLSKYEYRIKNCNLKISIDDNSIEIRENDGKLKRRDNLNRGKWSDFQKSTGNLLSLLVSQGDEALTIPDMLRQQSRNFTQAQVDVAIQYQDAHAADGVKTFHFSVMDYPYRLTPGYDGALRVQTCDFNDIEYDGALNVVQLHHPEFGVKQLQRTEDSTFMLPEEWACESDLLVFAQTPGYVLPKAINPTAGLVFGDAVKRYKQAYFDEEYDGETWLQARKWLMICNEYGLPCSSIWQLRALADDKMLLLKLADIWLNKDSDGDIDAAFYALKRLEGDLDFKWFWMLDTETGIYDVISEKPGALSKLIERLIDDSLVSADVEVQESSKTFAQAVRPGQYYPDEVNVLQAPREILVNQFNSDEDGGKTTFFQQHYYNWRHHDNEDWLRARAHAFLLAMRGQLKRDNKNITLFDLKPDERRSLAWCYEKYPNRFWHKVGDMLIDINAQ